MLQQLLKKTIFPLIIIWFCAVNAVAVVQAGEVDRLIKDLQSQSPQQSKKAAQLIERGNYSDKRLFDTLDKRIKEGVKVKLENKHHIDAVSWFAKALATSGDPRYRPTLELLVQSGHKKLLRHGQNSLQDLANYEKWNPVLASKKYNKKGRSALASQYLAMLNSDYDGLILRAAQGVYKQGVYDTDVLNAVESALLGRIEKISGKDRTAVQALSWLCKALGASGQERYKKSLESVIASDGPKKVKGHAKKALKALG